MSDVLEALETVSSRLATVVTTLSEEQLVASAYPSEWTIADVLSHVGSGAIIMRQHFEDACTGAETPPEFAQSVWAEWNAMSPHQQADSVVGADQRLDEALRGLSREGREIFRMSLGPLSLDFDGFVGMRLNELTMHLWDVEVALDPTATLTPDAVGFIVDNLDMVVRFSAKGAGDEHVVRVRTTTPEREISVMISAEGVALAHSPSGEVASIEMPAEAFIRLVFGRLDPDHSPTLTSETDLGELRQTFPGF